MYEILKKIVNLFESFPLIESKNSRTPTWFWSGTQQIDINSSLVNALENYSDQHNTNCRICFHTSPEETCHTMLIVERKGMNIPPHSHHLKSDFVFVLNGQMEFFIFNSNNMSSNCQSLSQFDGTKAPPGFIHAIGISSQRCTYLETSTGPFDPYNDAIYPLWASKWHEAYLSGKILT